jgi:DHA2 family multidrug resistance protein
MNSPADTPTQYTGGSNKWVVAMTVMLGTFVAVMDISVVNVALPHMMGSFGQSQSAITWIATSYSIAEIIMATMAGWWSTLLGRKRLFIISFIIFTIGSILCGMATTFPQILCFRILQGIGGGSLIPVSQAIMREAFPDEEQGMAMAVYGMGVVLAPAIGPILGGWLTDHYGWEWIFFINVPIGILGIFLIKIIVYDPPYLRRGLRRIDWIGIILLSFTLTILQIVLERGEEKNWFESDWIVAGAVICGITLIALIGWELLTHEPVVDVRLLRNVPLSVGSLIVLIFGIGLFGTTFLLPQFTQNLLGYTAYDSGLVLFPRAFSLFLFMPIVGWLYKRLNIRLMVGFGLAAIVYSYFLLARISLQASFSTLTPLLLIMGIGMPFVFVTLTTVSLSTVPRSLMTEASSLYTLARRIGGNIGYALAASVVSNRIQFHHTRLVENTTSGNPAFLTLQHQMANLLLRSGADPIAAGQKTNMIIDGLINRQARMMAYNDTSLIFGLLFLVVMPLLLLIPSRKKLIRESSPEPNR